jgi:hypothetical protein
MVHAANEAGARWKTKPEIFAGCGTNACQAVRSRITVRSWPPKGKKIRAGDINDLLPGNKALQAARRQRNREQWPR